jgi:hypothetical protein
MVTSLLEAQENEERGKGAPWHKKFGAYKKFGAWRKPIRCVRSGADDAADGAGAQT